MLRGFERIWHEVRDDDTVVREIAANGRVRSGDGTLDAETDI
jgi:hypothetical protein